MKNRNGCLIEGLESRTLMSVTAATNPKLTSNADAYKSYAKDPLFASGGPTIDDVKQGALGDCYLLATLSSVVETDPKLIEKDMVSDGGGLYTITFNKTKKITVDSQLPEVNGHLAYAQFGKSDSIWVGLWEKAYVLFDSPKTHSYSDIAGGWMGDVFQALGVTSHSLARGSSGTSLAEAFEKDLKAGDFVTYGTLDTLPSKSPLVANHAYEVDAVIDNKSGTPTSVKLRNPWGSYITVSVSDLYAACDGADIGYP